MKKGYLALYKAVSIDFVLCLSKTWLLEISNIIRFDLLVKEILSNDSMN